ncbi:uncharacterized protein BP5553_00907 [Venustampulla echinocandica]|uniref:Uncharacterized protein n=1 Tax=Venustampulla echinocandica TaxID=2656787 RepID=A0A370TZL2_9HELO|nr:uncharacterized protein BP5553_00907 [Venustampulla echinocandica]RDL40928.1 hypothetical protein BP5553_00907 [Venustampulla echinocandica]
MAISKPATAILILHALHNLLTAIFLASYNRSRLKILSSLTLVIVHFIIHARVTTPIFLVTLLINHCCLPRSSRITFRRHLVTAIFIAPLLAQITGHSLGLIGNPYKLKVVAAAACYDQLDAADATVLTKGLFCEVKYGISRGEAERRAGTLKTGLGYVELLAINCLSMWDIDHFEGGVRGVCWMGMEREDVGEGEGRNTLKHNLRRRFEECYGKFGIEVLWKWKGDGAEIMLKLPKIEGTKYTGEFIPIDGDYLVI